MPGSQNCLEETGEAGLPLLKEAAMHALEQQKMRREYQLHGVYGTI